MKKIADWENMSIIAFMCYILPVVIAFEALVSGYLAAGLAAVTVFIILKASPDSRLRYHTIQAVMTLVAAALMLGLSYWLQERKFELAMITAVIMALAVLAVKVPGFLWPQPQVPAPSGITVAAIGTSDNFVGFPWGSDENSTRKIADEQGWKTGDYVSSMTGLGCRAVVEGYPALVQFFYVREGGTPRYLYQGFVIMHDKDGPIEPFYQSILEVLTKKYGPTDEVGYPPWRSPGTQPSDRGYGWTWETTNEQGQKVNVLLALKLAQSKTDPNSYIPASLQVRYKNLTINNHKF